MSQATRSIRRNNDIDVTQFMNEVRKNIQSAAIIGQQIKVPLYTSVQGITTMKVYHTII